MNRLLEPVRCYLGELYAATVGGWDRFWFTPADPTTLAAIRIGTGLLLLYVYGSITPALSEFVGPEGWIDSVAVEQLRTESVPGATLYHRMVTGWWGQSIWFYVQDFRWMMVVYAVYLASILCWTLGLFSRFCGVVVWAGHLSFVHRSYTVWYGLDVVLAMLLLYLMFGPTGDALSLDRIRQKRRRMRSAAEVFEPLPRRRSWTANAVVRMIQVHLCIIYLCSGLSKLQGESWWNSTAIWQVMMIHELAPFDFRWLAGLDDWILHLFTSVGAAVTLGFEIGFAFLIWNRLLRPLLLLTAAMLHIGIGLFMGLGAFSAVMLIACMSFIPPESLRWVIDTLRSRQSGTATASAVHG